MINYMIELDYDMNLIFLNENFMDEIEHNMDVQRYLNP